MFGSNLFVVGVGFEGIWIDLGLIVGIRDFLSLYSGARAGDLALSCGNVGASHEVIRVQILPLDRIR